MPNTFNKKKNIVSEVINIIIHWFDYYYPLIWFEYFLTLRVSGFLKINKFSQGQAITITI